jgi:hypothetical protein
MEKSGGQERWHMIDRFLAAKGAFYVGAGVASPLLLFDHPFLAVLQTIGLVGLGLFNICRALERR